MTDFGKPAAREADQPAPKQAPPGLSVRAPRPPAIRLRKSAIQAVIMGGVVLVAGSLAWAFVVQPELRAGAQARAAGESRDQGRGPVRPAEVVTRQPSSYDRLPEPGGGGGRTVASPDAGSLDAGPGTPPHVAHASAWPTPPAPPTAGASLADQAARSALVFGAATRSCRPDRFRLLAGVLLSGEAIRAAMRTRPILRFSTLSAHDPIVMSSRSVGGHGHEDQTRQGRRRGAGRRSGRTSADDERHRPRHGGRTT